MISWREYLRHCDMGHGLTQGKPFDRQAHFSARREMPRQRKHQQTLPVHWVQRYQTGFKPCQFRSITWMTSPWYWRRSEEVEVNDLDDRGKITQKWPVMRPRK